jgi:hypothetical protein
MTRMPIQSVRKCLNCSEPTDGNNPKCQHCGAGRGGMPRNPQGLLNAPRVTMSGRPAVPSTSTQPIGVLGAILSLVFPGLGQLVQGRVPAAIMWFVAVAMGYTFFVVPGLVLHALCVRSALRFGKSESPVLRRA